MNVTVPNGPPPSYYMAPQIRAIQNRYFRDPRADNFQANMIQMQIELILAHQPNMTWKSDLDRSFRTLEWLNQAARGEVPYGCQ